MSKKKPKQSSNTIALNKKAKFDYHINERFEAGLALQGWEVKAIRDGKVQITDTYIWLKNGEAWLIGGHITPLSTTSTHYVADPTRTRKLLLHRRELAKLFAATEQKGATCVCTALYWKGHLIKAEIGIAHGKKDHDKRDVQKERDWNRDKARIMKTYK